MAATNTSVSDFVVFTQNTDNGFNGGIFVVEIPFSKEFWNDVRTKVREFYISWIPKDNKTARTMARTREDIVTIKAEPQENKNFEKKILRAASIIWTRQQ
eukprot:Seg3169.2 transcript_id=Seg3169.2/GoldUCD/mRNA.D3Y31 product="hypothetical protein" protein_id=Seg3169.2/GoldUCD/D3Y31